MAASICWPSLVDDMCCHFHRYLKVEILTDFLSPSIHLLLQELQTKKNAIVIVLSTGDSCLRELYLDRVNNLLHRTCLLLVNFASL